jgi:ATP-dependent helicase/nuclease subunit A
VIDSVIDRTFVDANGVRWIVDFKTGIHLGGDRDAFIASEVIRYRAQLEAYAAVFRALETRPIRLALYFPRLDGWREWAAGEAPVLVESSENFRSSK